MGDHEVGDVSESIAEAARVRVSSRSGDIDVIAERRIGVAATKGGRVVEVDDDGPITISSRTSALVVRVPEGTDLMVGTVSGRITLSGRLGRVAANTVNARITVEAAERVDARSIKGRVTVGTCTGDVRIDGVSGRSEVRSAGSVAVSTVHGRIKVGEVRGKVRARAVSGTIDITVTERPLDVKVESVSGRITITAPAAASPLQHLASKRGSVTSDLEEGDEGAIHARTHHGSVRIVGAG